MKVYGNCDEVIRVTAQTGDVLVETTDGSYDLEDHPVYYTPADAREFAYALLKAARKAEDRE